MLDVYYLIVRVKINFYHRITSIVINQNTGPDRIICSDYSSESIGRYEFDERIQFSIIYIFGQFDVRIFK